MNGVRSTFMRRGYLLTALSAAVLLAASPGTALAQTPVTDIDLKSIRIDGADAAGVVQEGTASNVTVTLNKAVPVGSTVTATIAISGNDGQRGNAEAADISLASTSVQIVGGRSSGSVPIVFARDLDAVDEAFTITSSSADIANGSVAHAMAESLTPVSTPASGKIDDIEEQTYSLTVNPAVSYTEATGFDLTLRAVPDRPENESVKLHFGHTRGYGLTSSSTGFEPAAAGAPATATLANNQTNFAIKVSHATGNDRNRTDDTVTVTAHLGTVVQSTQLAMAEQVLVDIHKLPAAGAIKAEARDNERRDLGKVVTSVSEGDKTYVWVAVTDSATDNVLDGEEFMLDVTANPAQALDARITRPSARTTSGNATGSQWIGPWVVEVENDEDVGMEALMLSLDVTGDVQYGAGSSSGSFSIDINDETEKKIEPAEGAQDAIYGAKDAAGEDEGFNPGESFSLMTDDLFTLADGYTAAYAVSVEGGAVSASASGDSIDINAEEAGTSKLTVTGTATMASSSFMTDQTVSNVASITFEVDVVDKMLTLMIEMPDNVMEGNVVEGMSYHIPVMTNRAVHEDTEVTFVQRGGAENAASAADYSIDAVTIMAGEHMAMAELMVTEDMMDDAGHDMGEQLVIYAMAGDLESNDLMFTIWDEAVPALPLIGQLLLALFLMAGGARMYRRRQS